MSATQWDLCFICQANSKESLRSTDEGRRSLSEILPKFSELNSLNFDIKRISDNKTGLLENLNLHNASYHPSCKNKYNQRMLDRAISKQQQMTGENMDEVSSPPAKRRSEALVDAKFSPEIQTCCFCKEVDNHNNLRAAGTKNATTQKTKTTHVESLTKTWLEMAMVLEDDHLIQVLSSGDAVANEFYYHHIHPHVGSLPTIFPKPAGACGRTVVPFLARYKYFPILSPPGFSL